MRSGLKQKDLAQASGVSYFKITSYEQGQLKEPRPVDLEKLVAALGSKVAHGTTVS